MAVNEGDGKRPEPDEHQCVVRILRPNMPDSEWDRIAAKNETQELAYIARASATEQTLEDKPHETTEETHRRSEIIMLQNAIDFKQTEITTAETNIALTNDEISRLLRHSDVMESSYPKPTTLIQKNSQTIIILTQQRDQARQRLQDLYRELYAFKTQLDTINQTG